jgi:hypothetical protein
MAGSVCFGMQRFLLLAAALAAASCDPSETGTLTPTSSIA